MSAYTAIIPAYNTERYIEEALQSVKSQTVPPRKIIVVDDGSQDATAQIAIRFGPEVSLIAQENRGPGAATTAALNAVDTPFVAGLDSDDLWLPEKIEKQIEEFQRDSDLVASFSLVRQFEDGKGDDGNGPVLEGWNRTTMFMRTDAALSNGPMVDLAGSAGEMIDWLARLRDTHSGVSLLPEVLALRRARPGSLTYRRSTERDNGYLHAARQAILRRRQKLASAPDGD